MGFRGDTSRFVVYAPCPCEYRWEIMHERSISH
jgi:hypothetical protein